MDENKIREIAQEVYTQNQAKNQNATFVVPKHIHSGIDSPKIDFFNLINRPLFGTVDSTGKGWVLPQGWTSVKTGTGIYVITHNFNFPIQPSGFYLYNISISHIGAGVANMYDVTYSSNYFTVTFFNGSGTLIDFNFNFSLSIIK